MWIISSFSFSFYIKFIMDNSQKVNWISVLNFLESEHSRISIKEKEWLFEKESLNRQIQCLSGELQASQTICETLLNRIRLLEVCLIDSRTEKKEVESIERDKANLKQFMSKLTLKEDHQLQSHRQFLAKIVADLGIMEEFEKPIFKENEQFVQTGKGLRIKEKEKTSLEEVGKCAAHLDGVTELLISPNEVFSVTVSEDCLIKVWNHRSLFTDEQPEPIRCLREHKGPLFSLAGGLQSGKEYTFFTSGSEGLINAWKMPQQHQPEQIQLTATWINDPTSKEDNTIWQMAYHSNKLLSSSSDGIVRLFIEKKEAREGYELGKQYSEKQFRQTAVEWLSEKTFMTGCQNAARITVYDLQGKICQKYLYEVQKSRDVGGLSFQVNRLSLIAAGCEDDKIRLFDFNRGKVVKKLDVSASITAMCCRGEYQIVGGCRDSSVHVWDIRTFKLLMNKTNCHNCKYDAGIMCLSAGRGGILTGGADGIMKLFT